MDIPLVIALLSAPIFLAIAMGWILLRRAMAHSQVLLEEYALAGAWVFVVGSLVWLGVFLNGSTLLGFGAPWTWITAAHFAFAGYGALTITSLSCRMVSGKCALRILRVLLLVHPVMYLLTAAGILGFRYCDEIATTGYSILFTLQLGAVVLGQPNRIARGPKVVVTFALTVPLFTMIPASAWGWGKPIFDLYDMVRYHGVVNAIGHVGFGLIAFAWGRPSSHSLPSPA